MVSLYPTSGLGRHWSHPPVHRVGVELHGALLGQLGVEEVLVVAHRHLGELPAVGEDLEELVGGSVGPEARVEVLHGLRFWVMKFRFTRFL